MSLYLLVAIIAIPSLVYAFLFRKLLVYSNAPEHLISDKLRGSLIIFHTAGALVIALCFVNLVLKYNFPDVYAPMEKEPKQLIILILICWVAMWIIVAVLIELYFIKTNFGYAQLRRMIWNKESLNLEESPFFTQEVMEDKAFWDAIDFLKIEGGTLKTSEFKMHLESVTADWVLRFNNSLHQRKNLLSSKNLYYLHGYIFRKINGKFYSEFSEFIILQGRTTFEKVINNPDYISQLDFVPGAVTRLTINELLSRSFGKKTGQILYPTVKIEENISSPELLKNPDYVSFLEPEFQLKYPKVFKRWQ